MKKTYTLKCLISDKEMKEKQKYDFSSRKYAVWCKNKKEQKDVLEKFEELGIKWASGQVATELSYHESCEFGFFLKEKGFGNSDKKGWYEKEERSPATQTITAKEYFAQFEEESHCMQEPSGEEIINKIKQTIQNVAPKVIKDASKRLDKMTELWEEYHSACAGFTGKAYNLSEKKLKLLIKEIKKLGV